MESIIDIFWDLHLNGKISDQEYEEALSHVNALDDLLTGVDD